jgi:hypothetical protein
MFMAVIAEVEEVIVIAVGVWNFLHMVLSR